MTDGERILAEKRLDFTSAGAAAGNSQRLARRYLDSFQVEFRVIDASEASTNFSLFGRDFSTPVMVAALSALDAIMPGGMAETARGAAMSGAVMWAGVGSEQELRSVLATGAATVKIVKPYRDRERVMREIALAEQGGALAVGMDLSFGFGMKNGYAPAPMQPVSAAELEQFVNATSLPFVAKGILSLRDAEKAIAAGAAALVVSHQGGTVLDSAVPPYRLLPEIGAIAERTVVIAECGIASGMDAFKALALGADGVCVGKAVAAGLAENGSAGVAAVLDRITSELKRVMSLTGFAALADIDSSVLRRAELE